MKIFQCENCFHPVFFENTHCEKCDASLGYLSHLHRLSALVEKPGNWEALLEPGSAYHYCKNHEHVVCNWLVPIDNETPYCEACELNEIIPDLDVANNFQAWQKLEVAKHRLVYSLLRLNLPLQNQTEAPEAGLAFRFLSDDADDPEQKPVFTGHADGVITINIAEADAAHREKARQQMGEPYRTLIGHFRHEVGHYYWERLVETDTSTLKNFRALFGDERASYTESLDRYYKQGPPADWRKHFISAYATMHPWEDWAETWAHYLHIIDTLETAYAFGTSLAPNVTNPASLTMMADFDPYLQADFEMILNTYIPLTFAINSINRSMGQPDLYPFVLPPLAVKKLHFVHQVVKGLSTILT